MGFVVFSCLVAARIATLVASAPVLGHRAVNWWIRIGLASVLTLFVITSSSTDSWNLTDSKRGQDLFSLVLAEAAIGLMLGLGISLLLYAGELMGDVLSQMAGFGQTGESDDDSANAVATRLVGLLTLVLFIFARGPECLLGGLLDSFQSVPVGSRPIGREGLNLLGELAMQSFELAVRGIGPAVAAFLAATAAVAIVQKVLPDVGLGNAGPGIGLIAFSFGLYLTVSGGIWLIDGDWENAQSQVMRFLQTAQGSKE